MMRVSACVLLVPYCAGQSTDGLDLGVGVYHYPAIEVTGTLQYNGKCLDLPLGDTRNGNLLWMWDCDGLENQQWIYDTSKNKNSDGFADRPYQLKYAADPSKCIDVPGGDYSDGTPLWLWDCNGEDEGGQQSFWIEQYWYDAYDKLYHPEMQQRYWTLDRIANAHLANARRVIPGGPDDGVGLYLKDCEGPNHNWCMEEGFKFVEQVAKVV